MIAHDALVVARRVYRLALPMLFGFLLSLRHWG